MSCCPTRCPSPNSCPTSYSAPATAWPTGASSTAAGRCTASAAPNSPPPIRWRPPACRRRGAAPRAGPHRLAGARVRRRGRRDRGRRARQLGARWSGGATRIAAVVGGRARAAWSGWSARSAPAFARRPVGRPRRSPRCCWRPGSWPPAPTPSRWSVRRSPPTRCRRPFLGGWHLLERGADTASHLLVATTALVVWSVAGALGAGGGLWIFVAGTAAGLLGAAAAQVRHRDGRRAGRGTGAGRGGGRGDGCTVAGRSGSAGCRCRW